MEQIEESTIYTIGHSNHSIKKFIELLKKYNIEALIDARRVSATKMNRQFDKENLREELDKHGISYLHLQSLGGLRNPRGLYPKSRWRKPLFQGYAEHMESKEFEEGTQMLQSIAMKNTTAYMCSEVLWWRCHRAMISDYLKAKGWKIQHIMGDGTLQEHSLTKPAKIIGDKINYSN